jgi:Cytochrome P460
MNTVQQWSSPSDREEIVTLAVTVPAVGAFAVCAAVAASPFYVTESTAQNPEEGQRQAASGASPIYGVTIPDGYRTWHLISVKRLAGGKTDNPAVMQGHMALQQLRAELGNDISRKAFREGKLPFPDGAIIAALHWNEASSEADNKVLAEGFPGAGLESTFAGSAVNVQFMVKDSKKYVASGGWGFADFMNGKPGNEALHQTCFPCHRPAKDHDYVFTRYAPTP